MHHGRTFTAGGDGAAATEERSLTQVAFIGSFPSADFRVSPARPEVALVGRSNVGKSSLLNALTGRRAIARISRTPGKTRFVNVFEVDGRFYLLDLPGYGYARVSKTERAAFSKLIDATLATRADLAGVVWLLDIRRDPTPDDRRMAESLAGSGRPVLAAITKADKVGRGQRRQRLAAIRGAVELPEDQCVVTSATTREGIGDLWEAIEKLVGTTERWNG